VKREAEIFDMDGTLCNVTPIRHLLSGPGGRNFHKFHMASIDCLPNEDVVFGLWDAQKAGRDILVVTARSTPYRNVTAFWLAMWGIHSDRLFMRPQGDMRPDVAVKNDILTSILARWDVKRAWEDNPNIWGLWESRGIPVTRVPGWDPSIR
jgi:hypothetical protein